MIFDLWIWASLAAAAFQTVRFMLQKQMAQATLSAGGATFARFFYAAPFIVVLLALYATATAQVIKMPPLAFWAYGLAGGVAQITATVFTVMLFGLRNFAVGMAFIKTEAILTVFVGLIVLGEGVTALGFGAIALGVAGVLILSMPPEQKGFSLRAMGSRAMVLGLAAGTLFAVSAVSYRGASLQVDSGDPLLRAAVTLAAVVILQTCVMALWLPLREAGQIARVWQARRVAVWIGLTSMAGSLCWFIGRAGAETGFLRRCF